MCQRRSTASEEKHTKWFLNLITFIPVFYSICVSFPTSTIKHIHAAPNDYSLLQSLLCQGFSVILLWLLLLLLLVQSGLDICQRSSSSQIEYDDDDSKMGKQLVGNTERKKGHERQENPISPGWLLHQIIFMLHVPHLSPSPQYSTQ